MNKLLIYNVSFPKLGIHLKISPIAFSMGNFNIYWYGIIIALGFLIAFAYVLKRCSSFGLRKDKVESMTILSSIFAVVMARIYYVVFYPGDFYIKNPGKIFDIHQGGIAIYGAIIGGFLALWIFSKTKRKNFASILDLVSIGLVIGQAIGRWGNFVNQEAFGTPTQLPWGMISENTFGKTVHPCFLYESLGCFICFIFLDAYSKTKKRKDGEIFLLYTAIYGFLRALIESLRTDSLMIPGTFIRVSQLVAILLVICSVFMLVKKKRCK